MQSPCQTLQGCLYQSRISKGLILHCSNPEAHIIYLLEWYPIFQYKGSQSSWLIKVKQLKYKTEKLTRYKSTLYEWNMILAQQRSIFVASFTTTLYAFCWCYTFDHIEAENIPNYLKCSTSDFIFPLYKLNLWDLFFYHFLFPHPKFPSSMM